MTEPVWLLKSVVLAIHEEQLAEHGGSPGLRDEGLLDSVLARPRQLLAYGDPAPDLAALAASYAFGLVKNHAFIDGNKRVSWVAADTFLILNGREIGAPDAEALPVMLDLAAGAMTEEAFAAWLRTVLL